MECIWIYAADDNFQEKIRVKQFPAIHDNCRLLSRLLIYFGSLHCEQYEQWSDCFLVFVSIVEVLWSAFEYIMQQTTIFRKPFSHLRSSLIRVHSICFHGRITMNCIWIYYVADDNFQVTLFATLGAVW